VGCRGTNFRCSLSRMRTVLPKACSAGARAVLLAPWRFLARLGLVGVGMGSLVETQPTAVPLAPEAPWITYRGEPRTKPFLDDFRICGRQTVLGGDIPMRPGSRVVGQIYPRQLLNEAVAKGCQQLLPEDRPCWRSQLPTRQGCSLSRCPLPIRLSAIRGRSGAALGTAPRSGACGHANTTWRPRPLFTRRRARVL
jgi:hypothetical protein